MIRALNIAMLVVLAATAAVAAPAKWVVFEKLPEGTIYIDPATIKRSGNFATMSVLIDYAQPLPDKTGKQVRSDKLDYRYDCQGKSESVTASSAHTGPMATGAIVDINPDKPVMTPVGAGTTAEQMLQRACAPAR